MVLGDRAPCLIFPSTENFQICQTEEEVSYWPSLHGIIPAVFQKRNAKNRTEQLQYEIEIRLEQIC